MPRSCRRTVRNCARIFAQARARKKSRKIARKSAKTSERSMKTDGSYATTARNCVTIARTPAKIGARGARIARAAAAGVGRHSPLRKRGSGRCPAPPCPLLVPLVEHLERVAIARHLPVFPRVLQPLLQLVHLLLHLAVRRGLLVAWVEVWVALLRSVAVAALDLLRCGILLNTKYLVVIPHRIRTIA